MTIKEIFEALEYGKENGGLKARFCEGKNQDKWNEIRVSSFYGDILKDVDSETEKYLSEPIKSLLFSEYRIFEETGVRRDYERPYFNRRGRLAALAISCMLHDEPRYLSALEDIIWAICDEYTWCVPAHLWGQSKGQSLGHEEVEDRITEDKGHIVFASRKHKKVIDLFAAETGFALSEIVYLLEDRLTPIVVARARKEIKDRILEPLCEMNRMLHFESFDNNWASVCAGSIGVAAIYLVEDSSVLAPMIHRLMGSIQSFLSGFENDGACREGLGYWNYGFGFYVYFAELLRQRTAGKIDLLSGEKIKNISLFQQKAFLSENKIVSFSDGSRAGGYNIGLTHYLKNRFTEVEIPPVQYRHLFKDDQAYRWGHIIRNFVWSNSKYGSSEWKEAVYYLEDSQWFISRSVNQERIVALAVKGGNNDEPHNHNDIGNFILHVNGESLLTDLGMGEYTRQYFGPERYSFFCNGSQGHSVPIIEGEFQMTGREYVGKILEVNSTAHKDVVSMDITKAYGSKKLVSLIRTFEFEKNCLGKLVISNQYEFNQIPSGVTERFITSIKPEMIEVGRIRIIGQKSSVDLLFDSNVFDYTYDKIDFINHSGVVEDVYAINLNVKKKTKKILNQVIFKIYKTH